MIATIDDCDADRRSGEAVNGLQPAEPGADDDHMMSVRHFIRPKSATAVGMIGAQDGAGGAEDEERGQRRAADAEIGSCTSASAERGALGGSAELGYTGRMIKPVPLIAGLLGVVSLALAAVYWLVSAGRLPTFMPGFEAGVNTVHVRHALARSSWRLSCSPSLGSRAGRNVSNGTTPFPPQTSSGRGKGLQPQRIVSCGAIGLRSFPATGSARRSFPPASKS